MVKINETTKPNKPLPLHDNDLIIILNSENMVGGFPEVRTIRYLDLIKKHPIETNLSHILIEFPEDTATPPSASELYENGNKLVRIRKFSGSAINSVSFDWSTPWDMDTSKPIQYRVKGIITEATVPLTENVQFRLSGYGIGDESPSSGTFGATVTLTKSFGTSHSQNDVFVTAWSGDVTITNIDRDTINQILFERLGNDIADTYNEAVGITEIEIKYSKRVS